MSLLITVRGLKYLLDIDLVLEYYEKLVEDEGNIDKGNFYIAILAAYASLLHELGVVGKDELSKYFEELRERIMEGPDLLNPYVSELLGILSEGLDNENFDEFFNKLRMLLREESLDRLEL